MRLRGGSRGKESAPVGCQMTPPGTSDNQRGWELPKEKLTVILAPKTFGFRTAVEYLNEGIAFSFERYTDKHQKQSANKY